MASVVTLMTSSATFCVTLVTLLCSVTIFSCVVDAKQVVEIDLRSGIVKGYSSYVTFLVPPKPSHSRRCDVQAVLRLDFSDVYKAAKFQLEYDRPRLWTLDISDSPFGDGYGGDNGTTSNMAETQIFNRQMRIYGNSLTGIQDASIDGGLLLKVVDDLVKKGKTLAMEISDEKIEWYEGDTKQFIESKFLYTLNGQNSTFGSVDYDVYIGLNRVVAADYRTGDGLCKATITLVKGPVDACATGQNDCDKDAFCFNTRRSYRCRCKHGFYGNGNICIDEDECEYENGGCVHSCTNTAGNFTCTCREGFQLDRDGFNCIDVNECFINRGGCAHQCINTLGSFECKCNAGYSVNSDGKTCTRGSLCSEKLGCGQHCITVSRGLSCACRQGYKLHPNSRDCIQTCAVGNGGCQHKCVDGQDGPMCSCHDKYRLSEDRRTCLPTCGVQNGGCERRCRDTPTGPKCSCPPGYLLHQDEKTCIDIDECSRLDPGCSHGCINTHGSFECICPKGYKVQVDQRTCMDIDECSMNTTCEQRCVNNPGSFECLCRDGYQLYGITHCADKDECSADNGDCDHLCTNSNGSYQCQCRRGYKLHDNGKDCVANSCNRLKPPVKSSLACRRHGNDEVCVITCNGGARFISYDQPEFQTTCGPSTQYQWSHERDNMTTPSCSEQVSAPKLKRKARFVFFANQCTMKRRSKQDFQEFLHKVLSDMFQAKKKLRCAQLCRIENINLVCGSQRTKFRRIARRTGKEIVRAEFDLHISPQEVSNKCDVECVRDRTARRLKRTLKILRKAINKDQFYVSFEGHSYGVPRKSLKASRAEETCPVGQVLVDKNCVSCSIGSYYDLQKEKCLLCSAGTFQDREGQVLCKPCPHLRTGVGMVGARNVSQCEGQCEPGWFSTDGHKPCNRCPVGSYQPDHGRTSCRPCGYGISTSSPGASSFALCMVKEKCGSGSYYNRTKGSCEVCPQDTYQPDSGQDFCIQCPGETRTDYPGATDSIMCKDTNCGGHIGQFQGYIQTPNWPGDYPRDVQCTWSITPEKGRRILVVIPEIFLASQDKCGDILVMRKSASPYSLTSYETCESTETPIAFTARSKKLWIQFRTNSKHAAAGFSIPYVTYNEEYQDLIDDIVRDGRLYSSHQHQEVLKDRKLLDALLEVIAQPYNYFKYANVSRSMFPESFIRLLTPKVRRFFT